MKALLRQVTNLLGLQILSVNEYKQLQEAANDLEWAMKMVFETGIFEGQSEAQLQQDLLVLLHTKFKRNGFFVEFGAADGIAVSNTYLLEKSYGWKGILAEPATVWHEALAANRAVDIDHACVWSKSNERVVFNMVEAAELSTIATFNDCDHHRDARKGGQTYEVETISLNDLLDKYNAPKQIDYLSVDTEGSEFEILRHFDFQKYDISIISCEHNHTKDRERICTLLQNNGYKRRLSKISKWDDWFFKVDHNPT